MLKKSVGRKCPSNGRCFLRWLNVARQLSLCGWRKCLMFNQILGWWSQIVSIFLRKTRERERVKELKRELKPPTRGDFAIFNLYVYVVFMWCLWGYEIYNITICLTTNNNIKRKIRLVHQSARTTSPKEKMLWPWVGPQWIRVLWGLNGHHFLGGLEPFQLTIGIILLGIFLTHIFERGRAETTNQSFL